MDTSRLCFETMFGQTPAKTLLRKAFAGNRLSHAYLFRGPDGVGKKRLAMTMAAYMQCQSPVNSDACGHCHSCLQFRAGSHPDFLHIAPQGAAIKIQQIRELKHALTMPPYAGDYRVVLIEDIHTMRREAANSLLKTLEEPPPGNLLLLSANQAGQLLPTIVSRCQIIPFHALDHKVVAQILIAADGLEATTAHTLAAIAEGSIGRARRLQEKKLLELRRQIIDQLITLKGNEPAAVLAVLQMAERVTGLKEYLADLFSLLRTWFRDLILLAAGGPESMVINQDLGHLLATAAKRWQPEELFDRIHLIDQAEKKLLRNCSRTLVCESLFFELI